MKKRNFETRIITGLLTAGMILSLSACGSSAGGKYGISDLMDADFAVSNETQAAPAEQFYYDSDSSGFGTDSYGTENAGTSDTTVKEEGAVNAAATERKLIKNVDMNVETREYDKLLSAVENKVTELGGYIESLDAYNGSSYYNYRSTRNANMTIRIPKDRLDDFLNTGCDINLCGSGESQRCFEDRTGKTVTAFGAGGERRGYYHHRAASVRCEISVREHGIPAAQL